MCPQRQVQIVVVSVILLLSPQVRASEQHGATRESTTTTGSKQLFSTKLTLVTNSSQNCSEGLTHSGVFLLAEYRLIERKTPGEWQPLQTVNMNPTDTFYNETLLLNDIQVSEYVQLRIVQPEHGGGPCNCWGVRELKLVSAKNGTDGEDIELSNKLCSPVTDGGGDCSVQFCGGSASVPRGVVYAPVNLTGHAQRCFNGSTIVDVQGSPPTNCMSAKQKIKVSFQLNLKLNACNTPNGFHEGVEVSVGKRAREGHWIPLYYFANNETNSTHNTFGPVNREKRAVNIRGYNIPYEIQSYSSDHPLPKTLNICGEKVLQDGLQLRWLQTTSLFNNNMYEPKDLLILDNVRISFSCGNKVLLSESFNSSSRESMMELRNCDVASTNSCMTTPDALLFGASCTTADCELNNTQITVSRIATTIPLNISAYSCPSEEVTDSPVIGQTENIPLTQTATFTMSSTQDRSTHTSTSAYLVSTFKPSYLITQPSTTTYSTSSLISSKVSSTTPITSIPTVIEIYEAMARDELAAVTTSIRSRIYNNEELRFILQKPPVEAVASLVELVTDTRVESTVAVYLLSEALSRVSDLNSTLTEEFSKSVLTVVDALITNNSEPNTIAGSTLLSVTEQLALKVLTPMTKRLSTSNIELAVLEVNRTEPFTSIDLNGSSIRVSTEILERVGNGIEPVPVISVFYRNLTGLLPGALPGDNDSELASPILSTSLQCGEIMCDTSDIKLTDNVIITLPHSSVSQTETKMECVFWRFITESGNHLVSGRWDTEGCVKNDSLSTSSQTVCECTHLTNFAILLSAKPLPLPRGVALSLSIIGYIGVSLSVIAMLTTIIALVCLKSLRSMRNFIHVNLCVSLILAQLTFVVGVTPYREGEVGPGCRTAAVIMQYLFLVSFTWMLMEGVVLYVALVRVFVKHQRRYMIGFFVFSYGAPLLYMGLCVPLGFALYSESDYGYGYIQAANETTDTPLIVCWLNPYTNFVWTFIVPVLMVILANVGFFIMALVIMHRHAKKETYKSKREKAMYWLKSSVSLVTIMGLTWIVGILVFQIGLLPLAYIFTIFVTFQGLAIFIIFVLLSKQVREAYSRWWKAKVAESATLSKHFGGWSLNTKGSKLGSGPSNSLHSTSQVVSNTFILNTLSPNTSTSTVQQSMSHSEAPLTVTAEPGNQTGSLGRNMKESSEIEEYASTFNVVFIKNNSSEDSKQDLGSKRAASPE